MKIIYYYPGELDANSTRASIIRPFLVSNFLKKSRKAEVVYGDAEERLSRLSAVVKMDIGKSGPPGYVYIDSSNMPFYLNDIRRFKFYWIKELYLLKLFKKRGYKIVLFYRDAYWCDRAFDKRLQVSWWLKFLFAHIEWRVIKSNVDLLLLPTNGFAGILPKNKLDKFEFLPGVIDTKQAINESAKSPSEKLELLYVGGLLPPFYSVDDILRLARIPNTHLTICCRENEWTLIKGDYCKFDLQNVTIVHASSGGLADYYQKADIFVDLRRSSDYYLNAFPYKYIESISYGLPVLVYDKGEAARIITKNQWGRVVNDISEATDFIKTLTGNKSLTLLPTSRMAHSWETRFREMENFLIAL